MPVGYNVGCSFAWKTRLIKVVKVISSVALFNDLTILEFLQILLGLFYSAVLFLGCMLGICPLFFYLLFLSCISFSLKVLSSFLSLHFLFSGLLIIFVLLMKEWFHLSDTQILTDYWLMVTSCLTTESHKGRLLSTILLSYCSQFITL